MIKSDKWITKMCTEGFTQWIPQPGFPPKTNATGKQQKLITPFEPKQVRTAPTLIAAELRMSHHVDADAEAGERSVISYGVSSFGYDARVGSKFKIFTNVHSTVVDPKDFDSKNFVEVEARDGYIVIPPNSFALGVTVERFCIPRDVLVVCLGKSTYARCGIIVNVTPLEPEWEGYVTLEFSNTTPSPAKIYANEGAAQFLFFQSDEDCEVSYADRKGKYQDQPASPVSPKA